MIEVDVEIYFSFKDKIPGGKGELSLRLPEGSKVLNALEELIDQYPELDGEIFEGSGKLRRFIQVRLNQQGVEHLSGLETEITRGGRVVNPPQTRRRLNPSPPFLQVYEPASAAPAVYI